MGFPYDDLPRLTDGVVLLRASGPGDAAAMRELPGSAMPRGPGPGAARTFAVEGPDDGGSPRFVGTVSLTDQGDGRATLTVGALPWSRGRGHAVRALDLALAWAFEDLGVQTVAWWAERGDWAGRRAAWRLGFAVDGTVREWLPREGRLYDGWVGVLTACDERSPRVRWLEVPAVTGRGVRLRRLEERDLARVVEGCSDERAAYWLTSLPLPYRQEDARDYLETRREQAATGTGVTWAITDDRADDLLGVVSLFDLRDGEDAEVGYWTHPAARGRGVMSEACGLAVRHAFVAEEDGGLGLARLRVEVAEGNDASRHVVEANGFTRTGRRRAAHRMRDGSRRDLLCFDQLASEYSTPT